MNNETNAMISIIIPVYNAENVLSRCLDSIISQTYEPIEIILINDGSNDSSLSVCKRYAEKRNNIIILSQDNGGTAKARNAGLDIAHGEFIMFVDADDYVKDDICRVLHDAMIKNNVKCVISGHVRVNETGNIEKIKCINEDRVVQGKTILHEMYCGKNECVSLVEVWGKLFRREMWKDIRFSAGMYYEDLDIMPELYYDCNEIAEITYAGYYYVVYQESASHGKGTDDKRVWDSILIRKKHIDFYNDRGDYALETATIGRLLDLIVTSARNGWIPNKCVSSVTNMFNEEWKKYKKMRNTKLSAKLKYELFSLGDKYLFKKYHGD